MNVIVTEEGLKVLKERGVNGAGVLVAYRCAKCLHIYIRSQANTVVSCAASHPEGECCHYGETEGGGATRVAIEADERRASENPLKKLNRRLKEKLDTSDWWTFLKVGVWWRVKHIFKHLPCAPEFGSWCVVCRAELP